MFVWFYAFALLIHTEHIPIKIGIQIVLDIRKIIFIPKTVIIINSNK